MVKDHIHINTYEFTTTQRKPLYSLKIELSEGINGTRHVSMITDDSDNPAVHLDWEYTVKTSSAGLANALSLIGRQVEFLDHEHLDAGDPGGPSSPLSYRLMSVSDIRNIDPMLGYYLFSITLAEL